MNMIAADSPSVSRFACVKCFMLGVLLCSRGAIAFAQTDWIDRTPSGHPPPVDRPGLAYDSHRDKTVLLTWGETWEWNGRVWTRLRPSNEPSKRSRTSLAFDSVRGRVVLFGGAGSTALADTWEWDGTSWTEIFPATSPPARYGHALAFDSARGRTVLFGGYQDGGSLGDTWEWDGTEWVQRFPATSPRPRQQHAMAYDSGRARTVLVGGIVEGLIGETWEWDGTEWVLGHSSFEENSSANNAMAYDASSGKVILFDGRESTTKEWDGATWTDRVSVTFPPERLGPAMTYDSRRGRCVLFGSDDYSDTWEWNGTTWLEVLEPGSPAVYTGSVALAYDSIRQRVLCASPERIDSGSAKVSIWEWNGADWSRRSAAIRPPGRRGHAIVYDSARDRTVLFSGEDLLAASPFTTLQDLWEWDGERWNEVPGSHPPGRWDHAMAFDSIRNRTVLFGGFGNCSRDGCQWLDDTWEWDGHSWTEFELPVRPPERTAHAMAFDSRRGVTVVFGGRRGQETLGDTWEWDGTIWVERFPTTSPPPRFSHAMAFDSDWGRVILHGGAGTVEEGGTWAWDGSDWSPVATAARPGWRSGHAMAYDARCGETIAVGPTVPTWGLPSPAASLSIALVVPVSGSESGGEIVTIHGTGFTSSADTSVTVGGAAAQVIDVRCDTIRLRTPAGAGVADVTVSCWAGTAERAAGYQYVDPVLAARFGNVNVARGDREDVLTVNGSSGDSDRSLRLAVGQSLEIDMASPSSRPRSPFVLYCWLTLPTSDTLTVQPFGLGLTTLPTPLTPALSPQPTVIWNNAGSLSLLGIPTHPSFPAPSRILRRASGVQTPMIVTLQGFVRDKGSQIPEQFSITNAVIIRVE